MRKVTKPFRLHVPLKLREVILASAKKNLRSLNAEITFQLQQAYGVKEDAEK